MKNLISKILFLTISLSLFSCKNSVSKIFPERSSLEFSEDLEKASPESRQGWKDGCETGQSAGSNSFYKMFYRNNQVDGFKMQHSSDYKTAWNNAMWWCYRRDFTKHKHSIWSGVFKGYM